MSTEENNWKTQNWKWSNCARDKTGKESGKRISGYFLLLISTLFTAMGLFGVIEESSFKAGVPIITTMFGAGVAAIGAGTFSTTG